MKKKSVHFIQFIKRFSQTGLFCISFMFGFQQVYSQAGNALDFDGTDDHVDCGTSFNLANTSFTIELWAKRDAIGFNDWIVSQGTAASPNQALQIGFRNNNSFLFNFWGNDLEISGQTSLSWNHWACVYDATTMERSIYKNGTLLISDIAPDHYQGTGTLALGHYTVNGERNFDGQLDEVRIWSIPLKASDIADIYDDTFSDPTSPASCLLAYYKLDEPTGSSTSDATGNGNTGTLTNMMNDDWVASSAAVTSQTAPTCACLASPNTITLAATTSTIAEDGTINLVYQFTRTCAVGSLEVHFSAEGTAQDSDYTLSGHTSYASGSGTITFAAGSATADLTVATVDDSMIEGDETVIVKIASIPE